MAYTILVTNNANSAPAVKGTISLADLATAINALLEPTILTDALALTQATAFTTAQKLAMGNAILATLPTSDPHSVGGLWRNSGVLTVSAG